MINVLINIFKPSISKKIKKCQKIGIKNLHINLYIKDIILFQAMPSRHFIEQGIIYSNENEMSIIHFFNKKERTSKKYEKFIKRIKNIEFINFESKSNINYLINIGNDSKEIEKSILKHIDLYGLMEHEKEQIKFEFIDFKERKKASSQHRI